MASTWNVRNHYGVVVVYYLDRRHRSNVTQQKLNVCQYHVCFIVRTVS